LLRARALDESRARYDQLWFGLHGLDVQRLGQEADACCHVGEHAFWVVHEAHLHDHRCLGAVHTGVHVRDLTAVALLGERIERDLARPARRYPM
jgi:hypothetical protein